MEDNESLDQALDATMTETLTGGSPASTPNTVPSEGSSPSPAPAGAAPAATPTPEPWNTLPKSWKKDYEPKWQAFDPEVRKYIHEREKQALDGIMMYKPTAERWQNTLKPFEGAFKQFSIDPYEAFSTITNNHMILKYGAPEQRAAVARKIIEDYQLAEFMQQQQQGQQVAPSIPPQLLSRLDSIEGFIKNKELAAAETEVEKFFSNSENEFAKDVAADMNRILEAGLATDLPGAYELAIWTNPAIKAKLIEREAGKIAGNQKPPPRDIRPSATSPAPTGGVSESIDETMANVLANMTNR